MRGSKAVRSEVGVLCTISDYQPDPKRENKANTLTFIPDPMPQNVRIQL